MEQKPVVMSKKQENHRESVYETLKRSETESELTKNTRVFKKPLPVARLGVFHSNRHHLEDGLFMVKWLKKRKATRMLPLWTCTRKRQADQRRFQELQSRHGLSWILQGANCNGALPTHAKKSLQHEWKESLKFKACQSRAHQPMSHAP